MIEESKLLKVAYMNSLESMDTTTQFTAQLVKNMHQLWLGTLYPVAGKYRVVDLSKDGFTFCHALYIPEQMERLENEQLAQCTPCAGDRAEVAYKIATVHAELLLIHPFREGNGRLARWMADLMALQAGFPAPDYDLESKSQKQTYFATLRKGYCGDLRELAALFASWIERAEK